MTAQNVMDSVAGVTYATDPTGTIISIGARGWRLFAAESATPEIAEREHFIGRNLFEFIAGDDVRAGYERLLDRVRSGEPQIALPCRCDAPSMAREMRLTITPLRRGRALHGFLFQSLTLAEHPRPPLNLFTFTTEFGETVPLLGMCSLCERVCVDVDRCSDVHAAWLDAERYYANGGSSQVRISHTVCPLCFRRWVEGWTGAPPPVF
ncbi:MAG: hypothetical protein H7Y60_05790 [Rhodospirillaceae bacterium]|nr:hypothetical protein [Rhodospirillales bacterium]